MSTINRRAFLAQSARSISGIFTAFSALQLASPGRAAPPAAAGYGPLRDAGPELALPADFQYRVIGVQGTPMSDGRATPPLHDGMAAFPLSNGNIRLIRNHELREAAKAGAAFGDSTRAYDSTAAGGTTSLEINPQTPGLSGTSPVSPAPM